MAVIKIGLSSTIIKSAKAKISLENIVIKDLSAIEIWLNENPATKEYYVTAVLTDCTDEEFTTATCISKSCLPYTDKKDFMKAGYLLYQSRNFTSKKEAKKEYSKILRTLENGDYVLKLDLDWHLKLEYGRHAHGKYVIELFSKMLRESLENYENVIKNYKEVKEKWNSKKKQSLRKD